MTETQEAVPPARLAVARPPLVRLPGSLSLVMPAHNEEANIRPVVERALAVLPDFADEFEIIVVDDGSRDGTGRIADELAADPRVKVIHHPQNRGYGGALTSGFRVSTGDHVMFMDSDRQFDIADIALLAPFVPAFDIVAGFRMERCDPFHRRVFAEVFNVAVRVLFGVHLRDIDCAFKIFRGDLLRSLELTAPGALINTEIQAKARRQGATLEQVGVHHYPRIAGTASGGSLRVIVRAMRETLLLWWRMRRYQPPTIAPRAGTAPPRGRRRGGRDAGRRRRGGRGDPPAGRAPVGRPEIPNGRPGRAINRRRLAGSRRPCGRSRLSSFAAERPPRPAKPNALPPVIPSGAQRSRGIRALGLGWREPESTASNYSASSE